DFNTSPSEPEWAALAAMDWADQKNFWRLLPAGSRQSEAGQLDNTPEALEVWAAGLQQRFGGRPMAVILEPSRGALVYMLTKYPHLVLFPVHPTTAARHREVFVPDKQANNRDVVSAGVGLTPQRVIRYQGWIRGGQSSTAHLPFQVQ